MDSKNRLHYGFLRAQQAWAELRRTGYPVLTYPVAGLANYANPPKRLLYPTQEISIIVLIMMLLKQMTQEQLRSSGTLNR